MRHRRQTVRGTVRGANGRSPERVSPHTLRHSFATHLLEGGTDIRVIPVLLGHAKPETTTIHIRVATTTIRSVTSPLDLLVRREAGSGQARLPCRVPDWRSRISSVPMGLRIAMRTPGIRTCRS
ncbi:tyrosine-type recombinase/integrase [uncultured Jannaschia sp.]|uniref:tyrosine-type recombinase/integrase n=1 Tax=uncultured Jannaschia sp. TaxID=293347 RepID=UPI00261726D8|nr:tyrosine-type recombinase/integrase [uncultured Jannaschia sp.]